MDTNRTFTLGASPSYIFVLNKFSHTEFLNIPKIFNHAHIVFGSVSCIQMFQIIAGEISAFKTKRCSAVSKYFAGLDFTSHTGDWFIGVRSSAAGTFIFFSQISHTNAAVHSAGGYKRKFIQGFHRHHYILFDKHHYRFFMFNSYGVGNYFCLLYRP
jgi:hypothetical protein